MHIFSGLTISVEKANSHRTRIAVPHHILTVTKDASFGDAYSLEIAYFSNTKYPRRGMLPLVALQK